MRSHMAQQKIGISFVFVLLSQLLMAQVHPSIQAYHQQRRHALLQEYIAFLAIPNTLNDPEGLRANADHILKMMEKRGIRGQLLEAGIEGAIPAVYGEVLTPGATTTIAFYAHYDGQPVNPEKWATGLQPFTPRLATAPLDKGGQWVDLPKEGEAIRDDWRLFARAAADDKAGVFAILNAYDAIRQGGLSPKVNLKFFFEGEEEKGSTHLGDIMARHKDLLRADLWVIADGPMHASGRKQVVFGVRGDVNLDLTVYGAKRPLHSGNYGNWAPNPAQRLVRLLASMKDDDGRVLIKGFYDDVTPLSARERAALAAIPDPAPAMRRELAFAGTDTKGLSYLEAITTLPVLNINGMVSANVGNLAANIIPTTAAATLDLRLVKGNDVRRQIDKVVAHIRKQGYYVLDRAPTDEERMQHARIVSVKAGKGYNAQRTSMDHPVARRVVQAVQATTTDPLILLPSAGGSLPLYLFEEVLQTSPITIPVVNYDNNQHGENENLLVRCLYQSIETMAAVMLMQ